jgi:hypothetical protein
MKTLRALCPLFLLSALTAAAQRTETYEIDRPSASKIEVTSVFSSVPPTGYAPVRVRVTNNTDAAMSIPVTAESRADNSSGRDHTLRSSFSVSAPARKTTEQELLVPLCPVASAGSGPGPDRLALSVSPPGSTHTMGVESGGDPGVPFTAYSHALARRNLDYLNSHSRGGSPYGTGGFAVLCDTTQLPADWRGLSGLDVLCLTVEEMAALTPAAATALVQWVKLGGTAYLYRKAGAALPESFGVKLVEPAGQVLEQTVVGAGVVTILPWDGTELDGADSIMVTEKSIPQRRQESTKAIRNNTGPLYTALGKKDFAAGQVGLLLLIFGIIVGPVNLFVFARQGRRHRLFYTTPIISAAAALLLLLVIYFQDGTGGEGHRSSIVYLDARDHTAYIHQQQMSRTGVLFGSSFSTESPMLVTQAVMPPTRWTRFKGQPEYEDSYGYRYNRREEGGEAQSFTVEDKTYAGDWFQSRAEQAQVIDAVQPTRGRIELKAGSNPPVLISSMPAALDALYYLDESGKAWKTPGKVPTGAEVTLENVDVDKFENWLVARLNYSPGDYAEALEKRPPRGHFYALSSDAAAGTVNTNESIEWKSDTVFLFGPLN